VVQREEPVGRHHRAAVAHRVALALLPEHLPRLEPVLRRLGTVDPFGRTLVGHAAARRAPAIAARTPARSAQPRWRNATRSADAGPCPVTTDRSSSQSGSV